jgi:zinc protease
LLFIFIFVVSNTSFSQVKMPRIEFTDRVLSNGLRVVTSQDRSSPTVAIQMWYHVGSKDDPAGRSGFAHLFEHMMYKSTRNMPSEMMDRLTEDVGGFENAETTEDRTLYYEVVPSNYLETLLWAEADRMSGLNVDQANFNSERDVVKEEYRETVLAPPYGRFEYLLPEKSFTLHPYRRPAIGSIADLDAACLEDVRAFHETFYRPDNATLVVVGDFDQKQLDSWVDKYFQAIPKPKAPLPRVSIKEPPRKQERRIVEHGSNVPLPALGITYLTHPVNSADSEVIRIAQIVLSAGESSRLYHSIVYEQQIVQSVGAGANFLEDLSYFSITAVVASGKKPEAVEASVLAEIKKMQEAPVTQAELDKAVNQVLTARLQERETSSGKATALGNSILFFGNAERVNTGLERLRAVTAQDVQRVMKKYFTTDNRMVLYYLPEKSTPAARTK